MDTDSLGRENPVHLAPVKVGTEEYSEVLGHFNRSMIVGTGPNNYAQILSIKRVQNSMLHVQYIAKKKNMDKRNPAGHVNEILLWHGTNEEVLESINMQGFNRSFHGKNGKRIIIVTNTELILN